MAKYAKNISGIAAGGAWGLLMGILHLTALLPFWALYLLADGVYLLLAYVIRYRSRLILKNLRDSFPDLGERELQKMQKQFYRNFADYIFETVKLLHISDTEIMRRFTFSGLEPVEKALMEKRPVVAYFSHCGNWEWAPSVTLHIPAQLRDSGMIFAQIYRPLRNSRFDALMLRLRSRFGSVSLPKRTAFLDLLRARRDGITTMTGFMSDQKPSHNDTLHVVSFLNHPTAFITGTETVARKLDAVAVYWDISKPSRGHYHIDMRLMSEAPTGLPPFALTDMYAQMLEETIRRNPPIWLWSHNRWKNPVNI